MYTPVTLHFFNVGANVGQTFDYLTNDGRYDGWKVWCFEPSPRHLPALMRRAQGLSRRYEIHVCPFGLRGGNAILPFYQKDDPLGDSFESWLGDRMRNLAEGYALHVPAFDVADFIVANTQPEDRIVLKLDCEGSEYDLLSGLSRRPEAVGRVSRILVEWHAVRGLTYSARDLQEAYRALGIDLERWMF